MRRRFRVSLYTENPLEADIIDQLVMLSDSKRQDFLRTLIKAGYGTLVRHKKDNDAMVDTVDPETMATVMSLLNRLARSGAAAEYSVDEVKLNQGSSRTGGAEGSGLGPVPVAPPKQNNVSSEGASGGSGAPGKSGVAGRASPHSEGMGGGDEADVDDGVDDGLLDADPALYEGIEDAAESEKMDPLDGDDEDDDIVDPLKKLMHKMN